MNLSVRSQFYGGNMSRSWSRRWYWSVVNLRGSSFSLCMGTAASQSKSWVRGMRNALLGVVAIKTWGIIVR
jgi:hypothetical protein